MKILGIDYGRKRIGFAITDESGGFVRGLPTITLKPFEPVNAAILNQITLHTPTAIVFGLPLSDNDEETAMSQEIRKVANSIAVSSGLTVDFIDESYSTFRAMDMLAHHSKKKRATKENRDRLAACIILNNYLREHGHSAL